MSRIVQLHSDCAEELKLAARHLGKPQSQTTPNRSTSNGFVERHLGVTIDAAIANLYTGGAPHTWYPSAAKHHCVVWNNMQHEGDETPHMQRHGKEFDGMILPYLSACKLLPEKKTRVPSPTFMNHDRAGLFVGWYFEPGNRWKGDYYVAPMSQFKKLPIEPGTPLRVVRTKDVYKTEGEPSFPLAASRNAAEFAVEKITEEVSETNSHVS